MAANSETIPSRSTRSPKVSFSTELSNTPRGIVRVISASTEVMTRAAGRRSNAYIATNWEHWLSSGGEMRASGVTSHPVCRYRVRSRPPPWGDSPRKKPVSAARLSASLGSGAIARIGRWRATAASRSSSGPAAPLSPITGKCRSAPVFSRACSSAIASLRLRSIKFSGGSCRSRPTSRMLAENKLRGAPVGESPRGGALRRSQPDRHLDGVGFALCRFAQDGQPDGVAGLELGQLCGQFFFAADPIVVRRDDQVTLKAQLAGLLEQRRQQLLRRAERRAGRQTAGVQFGGRAAAADSCGGGGSPAIDAQHFQRPLLVAARLRDSGRVNGNSKVWQRTRMAARMLGAGVGPIQLDVVVGGLVAAVFRGRRRLRLRRGRWRRLRRDLEDPAAVVRLGGR